MSMTITEMLPRAGSMVLTADNIRVPRATGGPVLELDLMTMAEQLRHEAAWSDGRNSRTVVKHDDFRMILTALKAGARLHRHRARGTVLIQVLSGHIRVCVLDDSVDVRAGHALSLDPHLEHEVEAAEDCALLITIAWPHDFGVVQKRPAGRLASLSMIADHIEAGARAGSGAQ